VDVSNQLRLLSKSGVRYIVLHKQVAKSEWLTNWKNWLPTRPIHEDDELMVYSTDPIRGRDFDIIHQLTNEIGLIEAGYSPTVLEQGGLLNLVLRWGSRAVPDGDFKSCIKIVNESSELKQIDCHAIPESWPTTKWEANEVVHGDYNFLNDPSLEPGVYSLVLSLENSSQEVGQDLVLGDLRITAQDAEEKKSPHAYLSDLRWGDQIRLQRYDVQQTSDAIKLTVYWFAEEQIPISYKVFVHLLDQKTGTVVAQHDAIPRGWTYPTDSWKQGETVTDTIELDISQVPHGDYQLQVGFYDEDTGERLPAFSKDNNRYNENAAPLVTVER
jgi:hypothetical protein